MSYIEDLLSAIQSVPVLSKQEEQDTCTLLGLYSPLVRHCTEDLEELQAECRASRRQSISDFINLAVDRDHDALRWHVVSRMIQDGRDVDLLELLEQALAHMERDPQVKEVCCRIIRERYFNPDCTSNEQAYLTLGISSSTFYRNIHPAQRTFGFMLWRVVIPRMARDARDRPPEPGQTT